MNSIVPTQLPCTTPLNIGSELDRQLPILIRKGTVFLIEYMSMLSVYQSVYLVCGSA